MATAEAHIGDARGLRTLNDRGRHAALAFEEAAALLDLEAWIVQRLRHPEKESTAYLQLRRDSGDVACVPLFEVQHNTMSGSSIGSLSLVPDLQLRDCVAVAMERTWQSALLGLPFGGASYGLVCDPVELSERELIGMVDPLAHHLNPAVSSSAFLFPGRGGCRELMARLFGQIRNANSVLVTGKPECLGGLDVDQFTAEGVAAFVSSALRHAGKASIGARVAIHGFGCLGQAISQRLVREGLRVIALADNSGAVYRPDGLILDDIRARFAREQAMFDYTEAEHISRADLLHVETDVLVLTSGQNELQAESCNSVNARVVVEADWSAVSEAARERLARTGSTLVPWFLATCCALVGSYYEGCSLQILRKAEELLAQTYSVAERIADRVLRYADDSDGSCEAAAYKLAIEKAASCMRSCGRQY